MEYILTTLFVVAISAYIFRSKIKTFYDYCYGKAKQYMIQLAIKKFINAGKTSSVSNLENIINTSFGMMKVSDSVEKSDEYIKVNFNGDYTFIPFSNDLEFKMLNYLITFESDEDSGVLQLIPGVPLLVTPKQLGYKSISIFKQGELVEKVEEDNLSKELSF